MSDPHTPFGTTRFERLINARHHLSDALERVKLARKDIEHTDFDVSTFRLLEDELRKLQERLTTAAAMGAS